MAPANEESPNPEWSNLESAPVDGHARQLRLMLAAGKGPGEIRSWLKEAGVSNDEAEKLLAENCPRPRRHTNALVFGLLALIAGGVISGIVAVTYGDEFGAVEEKAGDVVYYRRGMPFGLAELMVFPVIFGIVAAFIGDVVDRMKNRTVKRTQEPR